MTGDAHHFQWLPGTPGPLTIKYDFRDILGFTNNITSEQIANAVAAFGMWSDATLGNILFVQDTMAPAGDIINVGTGDLAALGSTSGPGGTLGLGGGGFTHGDPLHSITGGVAWQDSAEVWDNQIGNGNPVNTFDYFTVVTQEIGHALGLGHTDNTGPDNMMNGSYTGEKTVLSAVDVDHIKSVYGSATTVVTVPTMSEWGIITLVLTLAGAAFVRIRKLNLTNNVG